MAARIHRTLKVTAFKANGIERLRYEFSKKLQELHIDAALLSVLHLKPHESVFIPNYHIYLTATAVAVRKGIPHKNVDMPPLTSVEATGVCKPTDTRNSEILLASVNKSSGRAWIDADIIDFKALDIS
jgi:hypothetical protein